MHGAVNTRVTNTYCVQYKFQKSFVRLGSTHSHIQSVIGSTFGQQLVNIIQYSVSYIQQSNAHVRFGISSIILEVPI